VVVPDEVARSFGTDRRMPVRASFNGVPYRGSMVSWSGMACIGVTKAIMAEAGVSMGDELDVVLELDEAPREVEVPDDLDAILRKRKDLREAWDRMSFSHRREYVNAIAEAKKPETRQRRVAKTIEALEGLVRVAKPGGGGGHW
jgi:Bacteriocin-protection, YdeI or OmpD-Associated/Domain of unknown function (DUF1905)